MAWMVEVRDADSDGAIAVIARWNEGERDTIEHTERFRGTPTAAQQAAFVAEAKRLRSARDTRRSGKSTLEARMATALNA